METMRYAAKLLAIVPVIAMVLTGCAALTGKTAGEVIDDATITATVKGKLAQEGLGTLTRIDVDTNQGTVYLTGTVKDTAEKARAEELARQVKGVREVVNHLKIQGS